MTKVPKTFKREIALVGLLFWLGITAFVFLSADVERLEALRTHYDAVTWSIWTYSAAAFGLHSLATQWGAK